jgi:hypothetical protein
LMPRLPARAALYASSSCSSAKSHLHACRLARVPAWTQGPVMCRGARRLRRLVRSRMPVRSSSPMKASGWVVRIRLLMGWMVFSLSRLVCLAERDSAARGRPRALAAPVVFALLRMVRPGSCLLSRRELGPVVQRRHRRKASGFPRRCPRFEAFVLWWDLACRWRAGPVGRSAVCSGHSRVWPRPIWLPPGVEPDGAANRDRECRCTPHASADSPAFPVLSRIITAKTCR